MLFKYNAILCAVAAFEHSMPTYIKNKEVKKILHPKK